MQHSNPAETEQEENNIANVPSRAKGSDDVDGGEEEEEEDLASKVEDLAAANAAAREVIMDFRRVKRARIK